LLKKGKYTVYFPDFLKTIEKQAARRATIFGDGLLHRHRFFTIADANVIFYQKTCPELVVNLIAMSVSRGAADESNQFGNPNM